MKFNGETVSYFDVEKVVGNIFGTSQHKKRIRSIAMVSLGIIASASLIIHRIGRGMASALNLIDKHAIKQVDRLLSNTNLVVWDAFSQWVPFLIGGRKKFKVALDWTEFASDSHATIAINLITSHGRATPLIWKTVSKRTLKNNRNKYEDQVLYRLRELTPEHVKVTILADRGFCDIKLFEFLKKELKFDYTIRIRGNISVFNAQGEQRNAAHWVGASGRTRTLRNALITGQQYSVATVVCVHAKRMKEPWCIVSSDSELSGSEIVRWYAKRWSCEPQFRDTKDIHFGMGLSATHIGSTKRRDRLLLIHAIATALLTFLGAAGEKIGLDRYLKANTVKKRTLSLFRQGCILFNRLARMATETLKNLLVSFYSLIDENKTFSEILGII